MSDSTEALAWIDAVRKDYIELLDSIGAMDIKKTLSSGATIEIRFRETRKRRKAKR